MKDSSDGNRETGLNSTVAGGLPASVSESALPPTLGSDQRRTAACGRRAVIRVTRRSTKLMDEGDNLNESYKWLRDWLCHSGLIIGDAPGQIQAEYRQERVRHKKDVGTIVVIEYLPD
jgi:hypothetical protein